MRSRRDNARSSARHAAMRFSILSGGGTVKEWVVYFMSRIILDEHSWRQED
jgi:hypothetical protein